MREAPYNPGFQQVNRRDRPTRRPTDVNNRKLSRQNSSARPASSASKMVVQRGQQTEQQRQQADQGQVNSNASN